MWTGVELLIDVGMAAAGPEPVSALRIGFGAFDFLPLANVDVSREAADSQPSS